MVLFDHLGLAGLDNIKNSFIDFFGNIKVNMNVYAAGDFKSGPEGYTRNNMSETDKLAWLEFVTPIWEKYKSKMEAKEKRFRGGKNSIYRGQLSFAW